jgi:undecaprenyl-diphosphatase
MVKLDEIDVTETTAPTVRGEPHRPRGWVLIGAAQRLWRTLRDDCRTIPRRAWARWAITLVIGFALCAVLSVVTTTIARARLNDGLQSWDERWLMWLEQHGPLSFPDAILAESAGNLMYLIPLTLAASVIAIRLRNPLVAIGIQVAYWGVRPVVLAGWMTWDRARPKLIGDGIAAPGLHAFPSGHAALTMAVYGFLVYLWIRRSGSLIERFLGVLVVLLIVTLVSVARVRLGSHWPSDIVAGAALGIAWLIVVIVATRTAERSRPLLDTHRHA